MWKHIDKYLKMRDVSIDIVRKTIFNELIDYIKINVTNDTYKKKSNLKKNDDHLTIIFYNKILIIKILIF